jgi:hypothetical protein
MQLDKAANESWIGKLIESEKSAREQLNIAVRALERAKRSIFINSLNVTHDIISSALDQINGKGKE